MRLIDIGDAPPETEPWSLYPIIEEHPIELGDHMTCIICNNTQTINGIYAGHIAIASDGKIQ